MVKISMGPPVNKTIDLFQITQEISAAAVKVDITDTIRIEYLPVNITDVIRFPRPCIVYSYYHFRDLRLPIRSCSRDLHLRTLIRDLRRAGLST